MPPNIGGSAFLIDGHGEGLSILPGDGVEADRLALQAQQKFPDEYRRIATKYGVVEYILDDDGRTVIGVAASEDYIKAGDQEELDRLRDGLGKAGFKAIRRPLTSAALYQVALGQLAHAISEWQRIKTEPGYLRDIIIHRAYTSSEQFASADDPKLRTPESLLAIPRYVAMQLRYVSHNICLEIADWSVIVEYLKDIKKLDIQYGRYGKQEKRIPLMSQVKVLLDAMQQKKYRTLFGVVGLLPEWKPGAFISERHDDYGGCKIGFDFGQFPNIGDLARESGTLRSAFAKMFLYATFGSESGQKPFNEQLLDDISEAMGQASEEEKLALGPDVLDAWGDLEQLTIIIILLGSDGEDVTTVPHDARYLTHAQNCKLSEGVIHASVIERFIKSVHTLNSESVLKKIWAEMEKTSMKKTKKPLDKVLAFAPIVPTWTHKPPSIPLQVFPPAVEEPAAPVPVAKEASPPTPPTPSQDKKKLSATIRERAPERVSVYVVPDIPEAKVEPVKTKPLKVKTRGTPRVLSPETNASTPAITSEQPPPLRTIYCVRKDVYETMNRVLVTGHTIDWVDFEQAMKALEFSITSTYGSAMTFRPPEWAHTSPFFIHRPHTSQVNPGYVRYIGGRLKGQYGWTIDWFSDERPRKEGEAVTR